MTTNWLIAKLRNTCREFLRAKEGNTAVIFAVALIPMAGLTGAAVDYSIASSLKAAMQVAGDATALAMAQTVGNASPPLSASDITSQGSNYYTAVFTHQNQLKKQSLNVTTTYSTANGSTVAVTATATYNTNIMGILGFKQLSLSTTSTSSFSSSRLRVALVLDNTGSMADAGKITALKTASKNLIGQLKAAAVNNGDVYVSIVPFSKDVNVGGTSNYTANWINWKLWDAINGGSNNNNNSNNSTPVTVCYNGTLWTWNGSSLSNGGSCTTPTSSVCYNGTLYTFSGTTFSAGGSCTSTTTTTTTTSTIHNTWNGCVTDRDQDYDIKNTAPNPLDINLAAGVASTLFPAEQYGNCPVQMMGLSYDWTSLNSKIDAMSPNGNTNQAIGLAWGWQSLSQGDPLDAPVEDANYQYQKVIILLTDGLNTQNRWTTDVTQIDARQKLLCDNIKKAGITLYTIQVNTGGDPTSTLLQYCASDPSKSFVLTQATQIVSVFNQIGTNLSKLHIAK